jgi:hypothetical protein
VKKSAKYRPRRLHLANAPEHLVLHDLVNQALSGVSLMALTKAELEAMDEDELRKKVLVPLFAAMGFKDVRLYHGGAQEQGKDVVMWKAGDIRQRVNYAVIAKADPITGQAKTKKTKGKISASEAEFQVKQAFGDPFVDPVSLEERQVDRCFVVSSKGISKEAEIAIGNALGEDRRRVTDFIDGDKLWALVQEYLPESAVWEKLAEAKAVFDSASDDFFILPEFTPEGIRIKVQPKSGIAGAASTLAISGQFVFPDTPAGRAVRESFERHLATGEPVTIGPQYLKGFEFPAFLKPFLDPQGLGIGEIQLGPAKIDARPVLRLTVIGDGGTTATLENLHLRVTQSGHEQIRLESIDPPGLWNPLAFAITLAYKKGDLELSLKADYSKASAKQWVEGLRFQKAMAEGGVLKIEHAPTDLFIASGKLPKGDWSENEDVFLNLIERVAYIQKMTGVYIPVPNADIKVEDAEEIFAAASAIETGYAGSTPNVATLTFSRAQAERVLSLFESGAPASISIRSDETVDLFGVQVSLGAIAVGFDKFVMRPEDVEELRRRLQGSVDEEKLPVQITASGESVVHKVYLRWVSDEQRNQLPAQLLDEAPE